METSTASPELITTIRDAWRKYVHDKLSQGKGLPDGDKPVTGEEENAWPRLAELFQNKNWKQECSKRDEAFEMHFTAAVGQTTQAQARRPCIERNFPESDIDRDQCCRSPSEVWSKWPGCCSPTYPRIAGHPCHRAG
jgi:cysteinyl-tRNA synthetase